MKHTYYFRDNKGNTMGVYELVPGDTLKAVEHTLYSTDRFGTYYRAAGTYAYELKDHLGNVRATIDRWTVDETAQQSPYPALSFMADYYPFGWMMPDRKQLKYRYGYNDQELDEETGWYTFQFRSYDARIARFHKVDPLANEYPFWTPYQFAGNNPVQFKELEGAERSDPNEESGSNMSLVVSRINSEVTNFRETFLSFFDPIVPSLESIEYFGNEARHLGLDLLSLFDPLGGADALNAKLYYDEGRQLEGDIFTASIAVPFFLDVVKFSKYLKHVPYETALSRLGIDMKKVKTLPTTVPGYMDIDDFLGSAINWIGDGYVVTKKNGESIIFKS